MENLKWVFFRLHSEFELTIYLNRLQIKKGVTEIAEKKIDKLANLWKQFFEEEIGIEHMTMLLEHVDAFFTDIIVETENRGKAIKEKIDSELKF